MPCPAGPKTTPETVLPAAGTQPRAAVSKASKKPQVRKKQPLQQEQEPSEASSSENDGGDDNSTDS